MTDENKTTPAQLPHEIAELVINGHTMTAVKMLAEQRRWAPVQAFELINRWRKERSHHIGVKE